MTQRTIKFRAWVPKGYKRWNNERGQMLVWEELKADLLSETNPRKSVLGSWFGAEPKDPEPILMQYTGLKDKNGKEIYEGDVLVYVLKESKTDHRDDDGVRVTVEYGDGMFRDKTTWNDLSDYLTEWPGLQIIGNIYENGDLLTPKEQK